MHFPDDALLPIFPPGFTSTIIAGSLLAEVRNSEVAFFRNAVLVEAVVALICLAGLLFGDPGVVHRTSTSTSPLPPAVAERMEAELDVKGL